MSAKICRPAGDQGRRSSEGDKRKQEDDTSNHSNKTPPERCKSKKVSSNNSSNSGKKGIGCKKPRLEDECSPGPSGVKLPIPRLSKLPKVEPIAQTIKKQKPLQPKPSGRDPEFLETGNSMEQEEELLRYFQRPSEEETKVSQLRMLLERNRDDKTARRRVSFETVPESPNSQKKFSFVPISPISSSPFHPPKTFSSPQRMIQRSNSVNSLVLKSAIKMEPPQAVQPVKIIVEEAFRSQSVPTMPQLPQITPVPSESTDFELDTDSSNILGIDESSGSLMVDPSVSVDSDNLNRILHIINDMEISKLSRSYPNTPTYSCDPIVGTLLTNSKSYPCTPVQNFTVESNLQLSASSDQASTNMPPPSSSQSLLEGTINLFDEGLGLECEYTFNDLAREVTQLNPDVL